MVKLMALPQGGPGTARHMMEKTMQAQKLSVFGNAGMILEPRPTVEVDHADGDLRRERPAAASEPAALDFALAMRRVEAQCYDSL